MGLPGHGRKIVLGSNKFKLEEKEARMRLLYVLLVLICIWLPMTAAAEYYKYRDQNGVLRYTDNLADVPEDQRPKMETRIQTEDYSPSPEPVQAEPEDEERQKKIREFNQKMADQRQALSREMQSGSAGEHLQRIKNSLDQEYAQLMKEKEAMLKLRGQVKTVAEGKVYKAKVAVFNKKIADFEARRKAFMEQADAFNQKMQGAAGQK